MCDADGSHNRQLTKLGQSSSLAAWSPDGKRIAFQHIRQGATMGSLYVMNADGSHPTVILKAAAPKEGSRPAWLRR